MYRVRVVPIFLPRLAEREGDVEVLTWRFIDEFNRSGLRKITKINKQAAEALCSYPWPGNVRELRNNIEYAFAIGEGETLTLQDLTPELRGEHPEVQMAAANFKEIERLKILNALQASNGKKAEAAQALGMSRSTLWRKAKEYGVF
jgi:two-component system response regulator AtoC